MAAAEPVSVAIPVRDGGESFLGVLDAVAAQELDRPVELVVADSGSTDGTREEALRRGATVVDVPPGEFSHGGTRNLLMERSSGTHVAFLTDDSIPASERWLAELLAGFGEAPDVALVYGPYLPRPGASPMVKRELTEFFRSLSPDGGPRVDRGLPGDLRPGAVTFYTDANGCLARAAWERVPFRAVTNAEDHVLAIDMLAAGYAKVFRPSAAVVHSHDEPPLERFRHLFDEFRALREIYGHVQEAGPRHTLATVRLQVSRDRAFMRAGGYPDGRLDRVTLESVGYHLLREAAAILGTRADRMPPAARRAMSRDRRARFDPVDLPAGYSRLD